MSLARSSAIQEHDHHQSIPVEWPFVAQSGTSTKQTTSAKRPPPEAGTVSPKLAPARMTMMIDKLAAYERIAIILAGHGLT
jgi:hypothetical protein